MDTCEESHPKRRAVKWEYSVTDAMEEAEVSKHVAIDVYQWQCEICSTMLNRQKIQLGGPDLIVQMRACFGTSPRYKKPKCRIFYN